MRHSFTIHALLTFLLLFGQFSSLAHAVEHLSIADAVSPCELHGNKLHSHQNFGPLSHDSSNSVHSHSFQDGELTCFTALSTFSSENPELKNCLIFHLHGSTQAGITAEQTDTDTFLTCATIRSRENTSVIPAFCAHYDTRGPPADI